MRLTFSCGRSWCPLCLLGPLRAGVALLVVFPAFFPFCAPLVSSVSCLRALGALGLGVFCPPPPRSLSVCLFFSFFFPSSAPPLSPAFRVFRPWVPWALASCPPPPHLLFFLFFFSLFCAPLVSGVRCFSAAGALGLGVLCPRLPLSCFFFFLFSLSVLWCAGCAVPRLCVLGSGACRCVLLWALCFGGGLCALALRRSVPPACASSFCVVACFAARARSGRAASGLCRLCPPPPPTRCGVLCCASSCPLSCGAAACGAFCVVPRGVWGACVGLGSCAALFGAVWCRAVLCCFCPALLSCVAAFSVGSGLRAGFGLFPFLCSACAVLYWCACVVALCAVLSCPCGAGWCFVLLPVVFACLLLGLAVLCCLLVGPGGSWCRVSVVCCGVSLGAVLRRVAARCAAWRCVVVRCVVSFCFGWCCCALCCVLGRCPSSWGPVPSGAVFCLVPPRCVCSPVVWCCVVLVAVVLCACAPWGVVLCVSCRLRPVRCCCVARSPSLPCSPVLCPVVLCYRVVLWCPVLPPCWVCFLRWCGFTHLKNRCKICYNLFFWFLKIKQHYTRPNTLACSKTMYASVSYVLHVVLDVLGLVLVPVSWSMLVSIARG